jgi:DNA repair protein RecN (Recombination protein N)
MLRELRIRNLAVIEAADVVFGPGLNVLTGETGAGKSIVVDAILLLRGARAQADLVRSEADSASVEAALDIEAGSPVRPVLDEAGIALEGGQLLIRRELARAGRHRAFISDSPVTLALLERVGDHLLEVHGQHEHQRLLDTSHQLDLLDRFADAEGARERVAALFAKCRAAREAVVRTRAAERDRAQREDLLRFQGSEIDAARLGPGEEEDLRAERRRLQHAERFAAGLAEAAALLHDDARAAASLLGRAAQIVRDLGRLDAAFGAPAEDVETAATYVDEAMTAIRRLRASVVFEPGRLEELDARLDALTRLKRKYGDSVEAVLAYRSEIGEELDRLARHEEVRAAEERQLAALEAELSAAADALSAARVAAAARLAPRVERELRDVGMERARFEVQVGPLPEAGGTGRDRVEFRLSTNPGEEMRPLARVVSGGELSRTMLVLTSVLAADDRIATTVFDEVDAGIGGRIADRVGQKLAEAGRRRQVLCVTHLAPIAARATAHLRVSKSVRAGRTRTVIDALQGEERVEEIARMLGGETVSDTARRHARELLAAGGQASPASPPRGRR